MTKDRDFKKQVRARAKKTGETYTGARQAMRPASAKPKAPNEFVANFNAIVDNMERIVRGKRDVVKLVTASLVAGGHVLFTDVPGTGRSMLARALAASIGGTASRVQGTSDLEPPDILGRVGPRGAFEPGPIFANVVLIDGLDRLAPRTAVAVMEAMATRTISSGGTSYSLPEPFILLGGRHPAPPDQARVLEEELVDLFLLGLSMGYLTADDERELAKQFAWEPAPFDALKSVIDADGLNRMRSIAAAVDMPDDVADHAVALVQRTRMDGRARVGASPRATIGIRKIASVLAAMDGRSKIARADVDAVAMPVIAHRIVLTDSADGASVFDGRAVVARALEASK